jgi:hypothetical protein
MSERSFCLDSYYGGSRTLHFIHPATTPAPVLLGLARFLADGPTHTASVLGQMGVSPGYPDQPMIDHDGRTIDHILQMKTSTKENP